VGRGGYFCAQFSFILPYRQCIKRHGGQIRSFDLVGPAIEHHPVVYGPVGDLLVLIATPSLLKHTKKEK
jgi:hypothetical protein